MNAAANILPSSRPRTARSVQRTIHGNYEPAFCANCGRSWGICPTNDVHFLFVLCDPCAETHGDIAHTYVEPDAVFYTRLREEQLEQYGRELTVGELAAELDRGKFTALVSDWERQVSKGKQR